MKNRIELSCYTNMGKGVASVKQYIERAQELGMSAIAITDTNCVQAFPEAADYVRGKDFKIIYGVKFYKHNNISDKVNIEKSPPPIDKITVLARNKQGVKAIYEILSGILINPEQKNCNIKSMTEAEIKILNANRDNLLIGDSGGTLELIEGWYGNIADEDIMEYAKFFDYFEIQPRGYRENDKIEKLIEISKELGIPAIATCNPLCAYEEDDILCEVTRNFPIQMISPELLSTDELLQEYSDLPKDIAEEIVVTNTNLLADKIHNNVEPICRTVKYQEESKYFDEIQNKVYENIHKYLKRIPKKIQRQLDWELNCISIPSNTMSFYIAMKLFEIAKQNNVSITVRSNVGNSLVVYILGLNDFYPLKYNLHPEIFFGCCGEKQIDMVIHAPSESQQFLYEQLKIILKKEKIYYAGLVNIGIPIDINCKNLNDEEKTKLEERIQTAQIKLSSEIHPCDLIVIPKGYSVYDFTPLEQSFDGKIKTHFDYNHLEDCILNMEVLKSYGLDILNILAHKTGVDISTISLEDEKVIELFKNGDTVGIPEFWAEYVKKIISVYKPICFNDLVKINGLYHGVDVWRNNAQHLIENAICKNYEVMASYDDVLEFLINHGVEFDTAFKTSEIIRKGKAVNWGKELIEILKKEYSLPDWWIESVNKIRFMFPKAHSIGCTTLAMRIAYFKVYYPETFYQACLEVYAGFGDITAEIWKEIEKKNIRISM